MSAMTILRVRGTCYSTDFSTVMLTLGYLSASLFCVKRFDSTSPHMGSPVLCRLYPQAPVVPNGVPCSPYNRLCAFQYRTITFDSRRYKRDHPPQILRQHDRRRRPANQHIAEVQGRTRHTRARISRCNTCRRHARHETTRHDLA